VQGRHIESESLFSKLLDARRRVLGPGHLNTIIAMASLGGIKLEQRKYSEAEPLLRDALEAYEKSAPNHWRRYYTQSSLRASLAGLEKYAQAEPLLISGYDGIKQRMQLVPADNRAVLDQVREWIATLYRAMGQPEKAQQWTATHRP